MNPDVALETLVRQVTEEVQKRLRNRIPAQRPHLVILAPQPLPELEAILGAQFAISYYREGVSDCDLVLIPEICLRLLGNLANGLSTTSREQFVFTMLLAGKKVFALEEGFLHRQYKQTAPFRLYKMYENYAEIMHQHGICIVPASGLLPGLLRDERPAAAGEKTEPVSATGQLPEVLTKKVITEADLKKYYLNHITEIVIEQQSLLTPLAHDYLKAQQMTVRRKA